MFVSGNDGSQKNIKKLRLACKRINSWARTGSIIRVCCESEKWLDLTSQICTWQVFHH